DEVPDGPGVPGAAGPQPERAAQFVVVPGHHAPAAYAADRRRGERGGGGLVHAALGIGERQHLRAVQFPAQGRDRPVRGLVRWGRLPPLDLSRGVRGAPVHGGSGRAGRDSDLVVLVTAAEQGTVQQRPPARGRLGGLAPTLGTLHARPPPAWSGAAGNRVLTG